MASWENENHISSEAWANLQKSRACFGVSALISLAVGVYFAIQCHNLRDQLKTESLKLEQAEIDIHDFRIRQQEALEMQKAGFDPDQLDHCIYVEKKFRYWMAQNLKDNKPESGECVKSRKEELMEFPLNMRKEARRRLSKCAI